VAGSKLEANVVVRVMQREIGELSRWWSNQERLGQQRAVWRVAQKARSRNDSNGIADNSDQHHFFGV
jgi:hypothetical protein